MANIPAINLANYILAKQGAMNHLKLQKLLYYVEGYHLGYFGASLINEEFQAWVHGPVCKEVWNQFKDDASPLLNGISITKEVADTTISSVESQLLPEQIVLIEDVLQEYGPKASRPRNFFSVKAGKIRSWAG